MNWTIAGSIGSGSSCPRLPSVSRLPWLPGSCEDRARDESVESMRVRQRRRQSSKRRGAQKSPSNPASPTRARRIGSRHVLAAVVLVAVIIAAYWPAMRGGFLWDDDDYVSNNQTLRSVEGLLSIWLQPSATPQYYPLVHTSFWLEYRLWGLSTVGYHITNLVLHVAAACLLWRILLFLWVPGAWFVAAVFAVHPVHVESVAWITERKNVLSGVFYLSAMLAYLHFALDSIDGVNHKKRWWLYAAACGLFLLALLSKTVTATLPAALLILIAWKRRRVAPRDLWPLLPLFVVGFAMGLVTVWIEKFGVGAQGIDWQLSPLARCLVAGRALWFYAGKLIWPSELTFIYPRWHVDTSDLAQFIYPLTALATLGGLWAARNKVGTGPVVAVALFIATLSPALGFVDVFPMRYSFVADHFQYLASMSLIALGVGVAIHLMNQWPLAHPRAPCAAATIVILVLAALTWRRSHAYVDLETLWRDTIAKDPDSWMGHTSLGALLGQREALAEAEWHYREAIRANPDFASARFNLGALLANQGRFTEAIPQMREDVRLEPQSPMSALNLARALLLTGQTEEATTVLRRAIETWPNVPVFRELLDSALQHQPRG